MHRVVAASRDFGACLSLVGAFDDEDAAGRVGEPDRQNFLVFRRVVPAFRRCGIGEFEDDDPLWLGSAFDEFGGAAAGQVAAAILGDRRAGTAAR